MFMNLVAPSRYKLKLSLLIEITRIILKSLQFWLLLLLFATKPRKAKNQCIFIFMVLLHIIQLQAFFIIYQAFYNFKFAN